jgi:hypothetical protein
MLATAKDELPLGVLRRCVRIVRCLTLRRFSLAWLVGLLLAASPLSAQTDTFQPSFTVGAGIQGSFHRNQTSLPGTSQGTDDFTLDHARLYFSGDITNYIAAMVNTEYQSANNSMQILDAVGQFHVSPKINVWFGRFLPPSDRANLYGPFYANEWAVFTDGIQDGYPFVFQGRDNGVAYWGDFKAGTAKVKVSVGAFDGPSATGTPNSNVIWATRVQVDFWDPEDGYYLNGTYYGDKNLLAIAGSTQVQSGRTATTADFLMERKVSGGGAFTIESEYSRYNRLGGYNASYSRSEGGYGLVSFLIPREVGIGKFEALGKFALAEFTGAPVGGPLNGSYRQKTTEADLGYIIKKFDARIIAFGKNTSFNAVQTNFWEAGVGLQLQISKTFR